MGCVGMLRVASGSICSIKHVLHFASFGALPIMSHVPKT